MTKLLIADDDTFVLKTIEFSLTEEEIECVDFCESPEQAMELLAKNDYTRVISDWRFVNSELNGLDVLKLAKEKNIEERILMTSVSKIHGLENSDELCGIRKPISKNKVHKICFDEYESLRSATDMVCKI